MTRLISRVKYGAKAKAKGKPHRNGTLMVEHLLAAKVLAKTGSVKAAKSA